MEMLYILNHWHWWALATLLMVAELLTASRWFLALAIAAGITGLVARFAPSLSGLVQLGLFLALAAVGVPLSLRWRRPGRARNDDENP